MNTSPQPAIRYVNALWIVHHGETKRNRAIHLENIRKYSITAQQLYMGILRAYVHRLSLRRKPLLCNI